MVPAAVWKVFYNSANTHVLDVSTQSLLKNTTRKRLSKNEKDDDVEHEIDNAIKKLK